jgi:hypothetical protein
VSVERDSSTDEHEWRVIPVDETWRTRVKKPLVTDPGRRREAIDRATSLIKTTAHIDTVSGD